MNVGDRVEVFGRYGTIKSIEQPDAAGGEVRYVIEFRMQGRSAAPIYSTAHGTASQLRLRSA